MKQLIIGACFSVGILLSSCKQAAKKVVTAEDRYLFADVQSDKIFPPKIIELQFNSSGSVIFGFEYVANGEGPHPTVILLHANPGNERNLDIAQSLRRAGYNVIFFNFRGSWGSYGTFSYANSIADTKCIIDYVCDTKNSKELRADTSKIFLIGHNMGAGIGFIQGLGDSRVKGIAGISLFNPYTTFKGREAALNFADIKTYLSSLKMLRCDPQTYLTDIVNHVNEYNIEKMIAQSDKPVLVIDEHRNNAYLSWFNKKKEGFSYEVWDTDIEFSNLRIALTKKLKTWLDKSIAISKRK